MDAQTRHDLKTNELGELLGQVGRLAQDPRVRWGAIALVAVILVALAWQWRSASRDRAVADAWERLRGIGDPLAAEGGSAETLASLNQLLADSPSPELQVAARIRLGAALVRAANRDPATAEQQLRQAVDVLRPADRTDVTAGLVAPALQLLATAYEGLRDLDSARRVYEQITGDRFRGSPVQEIARDRFKTLDALRTPVVILPGEAPTLMGPEMPPVSPDAQTQPADAPAAETTGPAEVGSAPPEQP